MSEKCQKATSHDRAVGVFGWSRDEAVGRTMADLIIPERYRKAHRNGLRRYGLSLKMAPRRDAGRCRQIAMALGTWDRRMNPQQRQSHRVAAPVPKIL